MTRIEFGAPEILNRKTLQLGFVPEADCAPVAVAHEFGLFEKYELRVELRRESRWSGIRDGISYGGLDAAHAPAPLPFVMNLSLDSDQSACVSGMVLSLQGNSITVSRELWDEGVRDATTLRDLVYRAWRRRTYTFGVVLANSASAFLLRQWLKLGGVLPDTEVRIVVLSPVQMFPMLKLGYIDGFCASEPWTAVALEAGVGMTVTGSAELAPLHPEKVLMVRHDFAQRHAEQHTRMIAALLEACAFCDQPHNQGLLSDILSRSHYVGAPAACVNRGWVDTAPAKPESAGLNIFHRNHANDPTNDKATWIVNRLYDLMDQNLLKVMPGDRTPMLKNIFRRDIFERGKELANQQAAALKAEADSYAAGGPAG
jgi:ABC-type nitrate/sulfonate/bicarbonate transport system substrate-binding protein